MDASFARTLRSLRGERSPWPALAVGVSALLLTAWCAWFALTPVQVLAASDSARLEARGSAVRVAALDPGRIARVAVELGARVRRGDVLFELDAQAARLALDEARVRLPALEARHAALEREAGAESERAERVAGAGRAELSELQARIRQAEASASTARDASDRFAALQAQGLVADADALRLTNQATGEESQADALRLRSERAELEHAEALDDARVRLERVEAERAQVEGDLAATRASIERLSHEVDERFVRAPLDGRVGSLTTKRAGAVVDELEELAAIVPDGELLLVADFDVAEATGRVAPGQDARLRLDGFPWPRFGSLRARVETVAAEPEAGRVRVELAPLDPGRFPAPLVHGMTGRVEVEVERTTPLALVLRSLGRALHGARAERAP